MVVVNMWVKVMLNSVVLIMSSVSVLMEGDKLVLFMWRQNSCAFCLCVSSWVWAVWSQTTYTTYHSLVPRCTLLPLCFFLLGKKKSFLDVHCSYILQKARCSVCVGETLCSLCLTHMREGPCSPGRESKVRNLNRELLTKVRPAGLSSPQG